MPEVSLAQWNDYLRNHPNAHFLQTGEWGELKSAFGWQANRLIVGERGAQILFRKLPLGYTLAYIAKPAEVEDNMAGSDRFWAEVDYLCKSKRAILCKYEADAWTSEDAAGTQRSGVGSPAGRGFVPSPQNVQPRRTLEVDLRGEEETILARMRQKCRYNIRLSERKGVSVRASDNVDAFHRMVVKTGKRDGFAIHSAEYYKRAYELFHPIDICELLTAEYEGHPLAALMVFARGSRAWYVYGGSTEDERDRMPNYLLQWEAMRWARSRGCETYDLWGVPDEDEEILEEGFANRSDGLWGVYRFKRGFGAKLRRAVQAVDRVYRPLLYRAYLLRATARDAQ